MTTIVVTKNKIFADTQVTMGGSLATLINKCFHLKTSVPIFGYDDFLIAGSGDTDLILKLIRSFCLAEQEINEYSFPDFIATDYKGNTQLIIVPKNEDFHLFLNYIIAERRVCLTPCQNKYGTYGSGYATALGALYAGASPKKAIKITSKQDINTNSKVTFADFETTAITKEIASDLNQFYKYTQYDFVKKYQKA